MWWTCWLAWDYDREAKLVGMFRRGQISLEVKSLLGFQKVALGIANSFPQPRLSVTNTTQICWGVTWKMYQEIVKCRLISSTVTSCPPVPPYVYYSARNKMAVKSPMHKGKVSLYIYLSMMLWSCMSKKVNAGPSFRIEVLAINVRKCVI